MNVILVIMFYDMYIHTCMRTDNLPMVMSNIDTARIESSQVLPPNQVMKRPDPAYQDLSSFSERATVV